MIYAMHFPISVPGAFNRIYRKGRSDSGKPATFVTHRRDRLPADTSALLRRSATTIVCVARVAALTYLDGTGRALPQTFFAGRPTGRPTRHRKQDTAASVRPARRAQRAPARIARRVAQECAWPPFRVRIVCRGCQGFRAPRARASVGKRVAAPKAAREARHPPPACGSTILRFQPGSFCDIPLKICTRRTRDRFRAPHARCGAATSVPATRNPAVCGRPLRLSYWVKTSTTGSLHVIRDDVRTVARRTPVRPCRDRGPAAALSLIHI